MSEKENRTFLDKILIINIPERAETAVTMVIPAVISLSLIFFMG